MLGAMLINAPLATLAPFLALDAKDHPYLLYAAILGFVGLVTVVGTLVRIYKDVSDIRTRKEPTADFATKGELREVHARVDLLMTNVTAEVGKLRGEVMGELRTQREQADHHRTTVVKDLAAIERSLGRVEGYEQIITEHSASLRSLQDAVNDTNQLIASQGQS